jgi:hypothetical protein
MIHGDLAGPFGPISVPALRRIRNLWIDLEPLVENTSFDSFVDPTELHVELADGFGSADTARIDVQWSRLDNYSFHYVDDADVNWRFDRHPNRHSPEKHFHPPPDATTADAEPSCIRVEEVSLVTRAVHAMWRAAYESEDFDRLNSQSNPP